MPEGHTIHRLARDLRKELGTGPIRATSPQGRFAEGAAALDGRSIRRSDAWGKHLFVDFDSEVLHVHLGLIGKFRPAPVAETPRDTIRLRLKWIGVEGRCIVCNIKQVQPFEIVMHCRRAESLHLPVANIVIYFFSARSKFIVRLI